MAGHSSESKEAIIFMGKLGVRFGFQFPFTAIKLSRPDSFGTS